MDSVNQDQAAKSVQLDFGSILSDIDQVFLYSMPSPIAQSVAYLLRLEKRRSLVRFPARPISFLMIDDGHCDSIESSLIPVHCLDNGSVGKKPVALKEYCT